MRLCIFVAASLMVASANQAAAVSEVIVVAHASTRLREIQAEDLRAIFLGETRALPNGQKVSPVFLSSGATHEAFLKTYIGKSDGAFRAGWMRLVFTGRGTLPRNFDSESALLDYLAVTPGAIGYVRSTAGRPNVKMLAVR